MSAPGKNKWCWLASLNSPAHIFLLFICGGAFLPPEDPFGFSSASAASPTGTAVAAAFGLYVDANTWVTGGRSGDGKPRACCVDSGTLPRDVQNLTTRTRQEMSGCIGVDRRGAR